MLPEGKLLKLIATWKQDCGVEINNRWCVPVDSGQRQDMFKSLIKTLVELYGYTEEEMDSAQLLRLIIEASVIPTSPNKKTWAAVVERDWKDMLVWQFPQETLYHDPTTEEPRPKRPKRERKEYVKAERPPKEEEVIELENPLTDEDRAAMSNGEVEYEVDENILKLLRGENE